MPKLLKTAIHRIRVSAARPIYDRILAAIVTDIEWRHRLFPSLDSELGKQVLIVGPHSAASALSFATQYPAVCFFAVESHLIKRYVRLARRRRLTNVNFLEVCPGANLPFKDEAFDTIICNFALHRLVPADKVALMTSLASALRTDGLLHIVELDRASDPREGKMLGFAALLWGIEAVAPHFDDSWRNCLSQAGLRKTTHERSFSVVAGRISVIAARRKRSQSKTGRQTRRKGSIK